MFKMILSIALVLSFIGCTQKSQTVSTAKAKKTLTAKKVVKKVTDKKALQKLPKNSPKIISKPVAQKATPEVISKPVVKPAPTKPSSHAKTVVFPTVNDGTIVMTMDDNILYIKDPRYFGQKVYLFLFGRDCPYCRQEIGTVKQIAKTHKIIGVHAHKMIGDRALTRYVRSIGYSFPILSFKKDIKLIRFLLHHQIWDGSTPAIIEVDEYGNLREVELYSLLK